MASMRIHPINPAEAVIAPFFDPALSPAPAWRTVVAEGTAGFKQVHGYSITFAWDFAPAGGEVFTWEWAGQLDLGGYDGFFLQGAFPPHVELALKAQLDGQWQEVFRSVGSSANADYTGPFRGRALTGLRLEFASRQAGAGAFSACYLGVHTQARLADWLAYQNPQVYPPDWPEFIKPSDRWGQLAPTIGMYFGADELDALRRKIAQPPYRDLAELLRGQARGYLGAQPERRIGQYMPCGESPWGYSARARDRGLPFWAPMELCGFFGLVDQDSDLVRMALRHAICLAHTRHWSEGMVEHDFPGSAMNWRSFYQAVACGAMAAVMDWLGGALTNHAKDVLCHSVFFKGLSAIEQDFARYEYIYHMNQGVVFSPGRMAALLAVNARWPRMAKRIDLAAADLDETAHGIIQPDGSHGEGPGYYSAVIFYTLGAYLLLGRHRKTPPSALMPPGVLRSADYFGLYVSTAGECDMLPISDGGGAFLASDWIAMVAAVTGDPRWADMLARRLTGGYDQMATSMRNAVWPAISFRTLIYGPADLGKRRSIVPTFAIQEGSGHAASRRGQSGQEVYLHLCGSSSHEGHSHADKGSIILEAFGEAMLIDRGITVYNDPMAGMMKQARLHNLVTPVGLDGTELDQVNPCPKAICPRGQGDQQRLGLEVDSTGAWDPTIVTRASRRIVSPAPRSFEIVDEWELAQPLAIVFHLHSRAALEVSHQTAVFRGSKAQLTVRWDYPAEVVCSGVELHDYDRRPVNHLALRVAPSQSHRLVTRLEVAPLEAPR